MGREEELAYAEKHGIEVKQKANRIYSYDENMWANTGEGGEIEDPREIPKYENIFQWCTPPEKAPDTPELITITFEAGVPVALNGNPDRLYHIIRDCNKIGAAHGVGIATVIEDRLVGLKVRGVYENPGAAILIEAHRKLEMLVCTREENEYKVGIETKWAYLTYAAQWYNPLMYHLSAYLNSVNKKVTGTVKVKLYKGHINVVAVDSPNSLFKQNLATFERNAAFNQGASAGFIEIYSLPSRTAFSVFDYEKHVGQN